MPKRAKLLLHPKVEPWEKIRPTAPFFHASGKMVRVARKTDSALPAERSSVNRECPR
jgi:hypothetical protein